MTEREEFEAYTRKTTLSNCERLVDGEYLNHHIQHAWGIWQAATKKEREAEAVLLRILAHIQAYMPPDSGITDKDTLCKIIAEVDPWPIAAIRNRDKEQRK